MKEYDDDFKTCYMTNPVMELPWLRVFRHSSKKIAVWTLGFSNRRSGWCTAQRLILGQADVLKAGESAIGDS